MSSGKAAPNEDALCAKRDSALKGGESLFEFDLRGNTFVFNAAYFSIIVVHYPKSTNSESGGTCYDSATYCDEVASSGIRALMHENANLRAERDAAQKRLDELVAYVKQAEADCRVLAKEARRARYVDGLAAYLDSRTPAVREAMGRWE